MRWQVIKIRTLRWLRKIVLYGAYGALVLTLTAFLIFQIPSVQQGLVAKYTSSLYQAIDFDITFEDLHLVWYDRLEIKGLLVKDPENNTMIRAQRLSVNFEISNLWDQQNINVDGAELDSAEVNLITINENDSSRDLNINVFINRLNGMGSSGGGGQSPKLNIGEVVVERSLFSYRDDADSIKTGFDYRHFKLAVPEVEATNFKVIGDTIQFNVNSLTAIDSKTKLDVKNLKTFFRISQTSMEFLGLNLLAGKSKITDTVVFSYKKLSDFNDFNNKVNIKALLKDTHIAPADLALFAPGAEAIRQMVFLSGKMNGHVARLSFKDMQINLGTTSLSGKLEMDGLPSINETFMTFNLKRSKVDIDDLEFIFPDDVFDRLKPLGRFDLQGSFTGFPNDFVANGTIESSLGLIKSNINLKVNEKDIDRSRYQGSMELTNFRLGEYLQDTTTYQLVTLSGNVNGFGLSYSTADFLLKGSINSIGIYGYNYSNIVTNARFASQFFAGSLKYSDPNLKFNAEGSIDFRKNTNLVKIKANLDTVLLHNLGFSKKHFAARSYVDINSVGLKVDSLFGDAIFRNTKIEYNDNFVELDSIHVISEKKDFARHLTLRSSILDASLEGDYYYSTLFNDLNKLSNEFLLGIRNDKQVLAAYYAEKRKSDQSYDATINLQLHDINPLLQLAGLDLQVSKDTKIEGRFSNGLTSILHAYSSVDSITYNGRQFLKNEIEFTGSKIRDSANVLAMATITSGQQMITKAFSTKNLLLEAIWNRDHVDIGFDLDQQGMNNSVRLHGEVDFLHDSTRVKVLPSHIRALNKEWVVNQKNYTLFKGKEFIVNHLEIHHDNESVLIDGSVSEFPEKVVTLTINNLNLDILNTFSTEKFTGLVNGKVSAQNLLHKPYLQNNLEITDFTVDDFLIGNVKGINEWNPEKQKFDINFSIDRLSERTMAITGSYDPKETVSPLDIKADFSNASLKILEPILRGLFSRIDGELSGSYTIKGTTSKPDITGEGTISDGEIMVDYLKTFYHFTGKIGLSPRQIDFKDFNITDDQKNTGSLYGYVAHKNFDKFTINLDAEFFNLEVLNTTPKDNNLFYGQGFATGNVNIFGPASNLVISATARTEKNSKIYIPIGGASEVEKKDFITFDHFTDSAANAKDIVKLNKKTELTGITLDINLDITPAAYAEIIFDIKAGDIIRGRGNGDLRIQLDTKGEFNMFGGIQFTEGAYNFTLYDIINKEFSIKPGSQLTWYGDPYQGIMNITASYRQLASLAPMYDKNPEMAAEAAVKRKYPIEVLLKLEGQMLSPTITFDLTATDLPNNITASSGQPIRLNFDFNAFKSRLDEQELKRQVFSLIILRRLSPLDAFTTSGSIANSVSELLSNQLSYWLTQVDQNLEINLDLGALDQEAFNTFQLRLSYSFLNGRLRVTRDGTFTNANQQQQSVASIAGDWTVDYLLTPDGKFRVKMYSRSNFNSLSNSLGAQTAVTTGVSLMHTQNFNEVKDLLRFARDRRKKEMETEEDIDKGPTERDGGN